MAVQINKVEEALLSLYQTTTPFLEEYPWEMEEDRWAAFVICLFSGLGIDPNQASDAVDVLKGLGMLHAKNIAVFGEEEIAFVHRVMLQVGIEDAQAKTAITSLTKFSRVVNNKWTGYIQRFLRSHGERMIRELQDNLVKSGVDPEYAKKIATVWLQNVCNIPVLLSGDIHVTRFCSKFKLTEGELINILDDLGLNVGVADDLLAIENQTEIPKTSSKRKKAVKS